ncbi:MAG: cytochrome-c peroxidase [Caulobacteraceae bacterium]
MSFPSRDSSPAKPRPALWIAAAAGLVLAGGCAFAVVHPERPPAPIAGLVEDLTGANPKPVHMLLPPQAPLSALASLGQALFNDPALSASGTQSCASCHSPARAYGPPKGDAMQMGGAHMEMSGARPPPSLTYLYRQAAFSIGPEAGDVEVPMNFAQVAAQAAGMTRAVKTASKAPAAPAIVPQGGLFWDGRNDTLMSQASGPLLNPAEMANTSIAQVADKIVHARYAAQFVPLFGKNILNEPEVLVAEAMSAVGRYQIEDPAFHRFDSKYDLWLQGRARLSHAELHGLRLFNDPAKANCAGCHISAVTPDGLPPLFTDTQYEALGAPRNMAIPANKDPAYYDMGICGPYRKDLAKQTQYCGMFLTPTLRNAANRGVYFHNGVYHNLQQVMDFYNFRNTNPERIYPKDASGKVAKYNDLPAKYHANIDVVDAPFDRKLGDKPAMTTDETHDIIAFLKTLNDGYKAR